MKQNQKGNKTRYTLGVLSSSHCCIYSVLPIVPTVQSPFTKI